MKTFSPFLLLTLASAGWFAAAQAADNPLVAQSTSPDTEWTFSYHNQKVMSYAFGSGQPKPYVREFAPLGGENILRDSPSDHRHHHALMYGIKVNGVNFWEETPGHGVQKVIDTSRPETSISPRGLPQTVIRQRLHWVALTNASLPDTADVAFLIEQRTLTLTVDETNREVALRWESTFEVGKKTATVQLEGANYHGLGMRFQKPLDSLAKHFFSGGAPDLNDSHQDVSRHAWEAVSFDVPNHPASIALFGLPSNPAGEASFFSMLTPFAYLSATQGLDAKPLAYRSGETFQLRYLVTIYPELKSAEALQKRAEQWIAEKP